MADNLKELYLKFTQEDIDNLYHKGRFHIENKNFELAGFYFQRILDKQPQHFWATFHLAEIAAEQQLFERAIAGYEQARILATSEKYICAINCHLAGVYAAMELFDLAEYHYFYAMLNFISSLTKGIFKI